MNQVKHTPSQARPRHYSAKPLDLSSWIDTVLYKRTPDGRAYLGIFLRSEPGTGHEPVALLYGPEILPDGTVRDIPSWLPGLVQAGAGRRSVGRAYNKLVKGRFPYQRVTGAEAVALREMLK